MTRAPQPHEREAQLDLSHLRRETRTALELAVVSLAPTSLIDQLASAAGLLEALVELPPDSAPVVALVPRVVKRSQAALEKWRRWRTAHPTGGKA
jgi:hypothetical protein